MGLGKGRRQVREKVIRTVTGVFRDQSRKTTGAKIKKKKRLLTPPQEKGVEKLPALGGRGSSGGYPYPSQRNRYARNNPIKKTVRSVKGKEEGRTVKKGTSAIVEKSRSGAKKKRRE